MPNYTDKTPGRPQTGQRGMLKNCILLALPLLSLHLEVLAIIKRGLKEQEVRKARAEDINSSFVKPIQNLVLRELHAVTMILDPSRKLRSLFDPNLEKQLADEFIETFQKLASGSVNLIEAQELILNRVMAVLKQLKNDNRDEFRTTKPRPGK